MMQFWQKLGDDWEAVAINAAVEQSSFERGGLRLHSFFVDGMQKVALMTHDARLRVNGIPVVAGLKILEDRDEILARGRRYYFSAESPPEVTVFRATDGKRVRCAVCRMDVQNGDRVVHCPRCGLVFHQIDDPDGRPKKHCWTHRDTCVRCNHPTTISAEFAWNPAKEDGCG